MFTRKQWAILLVFVGLAFTTGFIVRGGGSPAPSISAPESTATVTEWTCSMHPQIRQPKPGLCPICAMELIPVSTGDDHQSDNPRQIKLSPAAIKLAHIQTSPVERRALSAELRLVGKLDVDETRLTKITAWIPGRIDKLHIDFTGTTVNNGQPVADVYSPKLLTLQEEYLQALRLKSDVLVNASRKKLELFGLSAAQIQAIQDRGSAEDHITVLAPASGIVTHKNAVEGMYVNTGTEIYTLADLSNLWVWLEAYESDLSWIHEGLPVELTTEAYPGESFTGNIEFIDPILNPHTRTVNFRVSVPNPQGKLKPEMFVRALLQADPSTTRPPLVIPASAPLITGKRAVVYVADPEQEGVFEGREIVLGDRVGDFYIVKRGLGEGEHVVTYGNFKIDSALQILAKPSMMNPEGGATSSAHQHGEMPVARTPVAASSPPSLLEVPPVFQRQLDAVFSAYFEIQQALSHDNLEDAKAAGNAMTRALENVDMSVLQDDAHHLWMSHLPVLKDNAAGIARAIVIDIARTKFEKLSTTLISVAKQFDISDTQPVLVFHCPMAFGDQGADWLQNKPGVENPYFGAQMLRCGEQIETIIP
ncbi:MAG: efflux RND transporter periplasmic adaptor subunit [Gemmatimonadetes bacterium]|nr:MAG: efflux RND transporter periplasmic adaptor subunit [Gemmatimonadota bacterium]